MHLQSIYSFPHVREPRTINTRKLHEIIMAKNYKVIAKVFGNGKVTIPQEVRRFLKVGDGDTVELVVSKIEEANT